MNDELKQLWYSVKRLTKVWPTATGPIDVECRPRSDEYVYIVSVDGQRQQAQLDLPEERTTPKFAAAVVAGSTSVRMNECRSPLRK